MTKLKIENVNVIYDGLQVVTLIPEGVRIPDKVLFDNLIKAFNS